MLAWVKIKCQGRRVMPDDIVRVHVYREHRDGRGREGVTVNKTKWRMARERQWTLTSRVNKSKRRRKGRQGLLGSHFGSRGLVRGKRVGMEKGVLATAEGGFEVMGCRVQTALSVKIID